MCNNSFVIQYNCNVKDIVNICFLKEKIACLQKCKRSIEIAILHCKCSTLGKQTYIFHIILRFSFSVLFG